MASLPFVGSAWKHRKPMSGAQMIIVASAVAFALFLIWASIAKVDEVMHFAAQYSVPASQRAAQQYAKSNCHGFINMIEPTLKGYIREHKRYATIAIGCTGGRHRSVAISEELARRIGTIPGVSVTLKHRDIGRE